MGQSKNGVRYMVFGMVVTGLWGLMALLLPALAFSDSRRDWAEYANEFGGHIVVGAVLLAVSQGLSKWAVTTLEKRMHRRTFDGTR